MISRHWIGVVKPDCVTTYINHLDKVVIPNLSQIEGMNNAYYLKRVVKEGVEFLVITEWESKEAIIRFAGPQFDKSVVDDFAKSLMASFEEKVRHYNI
jgi:heme-degrading monooxygenase HmoA